MKGMNFTEVDADKGADLIESLLTDPNYAVEQKMDGTRVLVEIDPDGAVAFTTRSGAPLKHTAALQHLPALRDALAPIITFSTLTSSRFVIDGELIIGTGVYHPFDLPVWHVTQRPEEDESSASLLDRPYRERRSMLDDLLMPLIDEQRIQPVRSARSTEDKRALLAETERRGAEGVMIKSLSAPYEPGKRVRHTVKVKHVKEADVVVLSAERGTTAAGNPSGSATFGVYNDEGYIVRLGSCSLIGKPDVGVGDVITVAYLYFTDSSIVQPRMRCVRHDKDMTECGFDQFPQYSREVV